MPRGVCHNPSEKKWRRKVNAKGTDNQNQTEKKIRQKHPTIRLSPVIAFFDIIGSYGQNISGKIKKGRRN